MRHRQPQTNISVKMMLNLSWMWQKILMCSILKVNNSNSKSGSPKFWGLWDLQGQAKGQKYLLQGIITWPTCHGSEWRFIVLSFYGEAHSVPLLQFHLPFRCYLYMFLPYANYRVFSSAVDVHTRKPLCGKDWWINVIKSFNRKDILKPQCQSTTIIH